MSVCPFHKNVFGFRVIVHPAVFWHCSEKQVSNILYCDTRKEMCSDVSWQQEFKATMLFVIAFSTSCPFTFLLSLHFQFDNTVLIITLLVCILKTILGNTI